MIKIQNQYLKDVAEFLQNNITTKGKKNIHRMRIVKIIQDRYKEVVEEEVTLLKEYAKTDENGEVIRNKDGGLDIEDKKGFNEQHKALFDEYFVIDGINLEPALKTVEKLVNEHDKELVGKPAEMHFILSDAFEENKTEEEQE
ncbi:hypothetical protein KGF86_16460 [Ornithinibacillus massiliensis]|uniref:DUF1617 family protein n=1 Tax=Ornithinibacillus massiliensis TaxID=1944633 RepID=A0ABS5MHK0_9BACI|nr:hypothetical protein [Ornithinibacillus massiliensis]MBS3681788.1 hypothetical protein [Ornithinibacillus massiliensis]